MQRGIQGLALLVVCACAAVRAQSGLSSSHFADPSGNPRVVSLTVVDQNGVTIPGAQVVVEEPGRPPFRIATDYDGRCSWTLRQPEPYTIRVERPGFY